MLNIFQDLRSMSYNPNTWQILFLRPFAEGGLRINPSILCIRVGLALSSVLCPVSNRMGMSLYLGIVPKRIRRTNSKPSNSGISISQITTLLIPICCNKRPTKSNETGSSPINIKFTRARLFATINPSTETLDKRQNTVAELTAKNQFFPFVKACANSEKQHNNNHCK